MADDPNSLWECEGEPPDYNKHQLFENLAGTEKCMICGRPRNFKPRPRFPKIIAITAILAMLIGGAGYAASRLFQPCPMGQEKQGLSNCVATGIQTPTPTPTPTQTGSQGVIPPPLSPPSPPNERYSSGENRLFTGKPNPDGDRGIEAFKNKQYRQAEQDFEKAVQGDRNSPEFQIYLNNAKARLKGSPFVVAAVVPVDSGTSSAEEILRGVADAQTQFNNTGGLNGQLVEVIIANDSNNPEKAEEVAKKLSNDPNVLGVIGHNSSDASKRGLSEYLKAGIPMISPTSTSTDLSGDVFFRTLPSDAINAQKLAEYARNTLGLEAVVTFYNPNSNYSKSLDAAFTTAFKQLGGTVLKTINLTDKSLDPPAAIKSLQGQAGAIVLFPNTDYVPVAISLAVANNNQMKLLGGDALYNPNTLISGSNAVNGLTLAVPWLAEGSYAEKSEKRWLGQVSWRTAMSFDATQALINALSDKASRSTVLQNLKSISLSSSNTSGKALQFEATGDRQGDSILVQALPGGKNKPKDSDFSFQPVK